MGKFKYWQAKKDGQWYFHLKAENNEIIAQSEGYATKGNCLISIDSVKRNAPNADLEEIEDE